MRAEAARRFHGKTQSPHAPDRAESICGVFCWLRDLLTHADSQSNPITEGHPWQRPPDQFGKKMIPPKTPRTNPITEGLSLSGHVPCRAVPRGALPGHAVRCRGGISETRRGVMARCVVEGNDLPRATPFKAPLSLKRRHVMP